MLLISRQEEHFLRSLRGASFNLPKATFSALYVCLLHGQTRICQYYAHMKLWSYIYIYMNIYVYIQSVDLQFVSFAIRSFLIRPVCLTGTLLRNNITHHGDLHTAYNMWTWNVLEVSWASVEYGVESVCEVRWKCLESVWEVRRKCWWKLSWKKFQPKINTGSLGWRTSKEAKRHRGESNPCGKSPMDF